MTLLEFADWLDRRKPSAVQLEIGSPGYNSAVVSTLQWVSKEARRLADPQDDTIHVLNYGFPLCGFTNKPPVDWPNGHRWIGADEADLATCKKCKVAIKNFSGDNSPP